MKLTKTIEDERVIRLSVEAQLRFAELLAKPPGRNAAMERAHKAHGRLIVWSE